MELNEVNSLMRKQNTILTLIDEDDSEKLLAIKVDVGYE